MRRRQWHPTPVFLPGKSHGQRSLVGCSPWGREELDMIDFPFTFHFCALQKEMTTHIQCSCLENPRDGGAWWEPVYGVAQSRTRLKRLSSSSIEMHLYYIQTYCQRKLKRKGYLLLVLSFNFSFLFHIQNVLFICFRDSGSLRVQVSHNSLCLLSFSILLKASRAFQMIHFYHFSSHFSNKYSFPQSCFSNCLQNNKKVMHQGDHIVQYSASQTFTSFNVYTSLQLLLGCGISFN